jgi:hypothetical protein
MKPFAERWGMMNVVYSELKYAVLPSATYAILWPFLRCARECWRPGICYKEDHDLWSVNTEGSYYDKFTTKEVSKP